MDDPQRFSGRVAELKVLSDALQTKGSVPLIYGQRGLGKSSLAAQVSRIAQGDVELLEELDLGTHILPPDQQFITFYVTCDDSTGSLKGLQKSMINAIETMKHERDGDEKKDAYRLVDKKTKRRLSLKIFSTETTKTYQAAVKDRDMSGLSVSEKLIALAEILTDTYQQPVLFVVDEIDRLNGVKGLASFLKSNSSEIFKVALVGIGVTEGELLRDHASLGRQLSSVQIKAMKPGELVSIVDQTEAYLAENSLEYTFTHAAKHELSRLASGFPWFVHAIGQQALIAAEDNKKTEIRKSDIEAAVQKMVQSTLARTYYDLYQKAVMSSRHREYVLRLFAEWHAEDVPTSEIYPRAQLLGVTGVGNYVGHLTSAKNGPVLVKSPGAYYRFIDEMFKVYCRIRSSIYENVSEQVTKAWD